ncbi:MAG: DUF4982 domain-containing protein, partial [Bacteroidales bacterium]|nr:DUF4982 domain-containing protein [Bacteroidales bacterium]
WTWPGREGEITPVHVYSSADEAELFLNGVSQGRLEAEGYRFVWPNVRYKSGTLEVVTYKNGAVWAKDKVRTAGAPYRLAVSLDFKGEELNYITVDIVDGNGTLCPNASNVVAFSIKGPAEVVATDAGDPTSHIPFYSKELPAFHGKASAIVRRTGPGPITVYAKSRGFNTASYTIK